MQQRALYTAVYNVQQFENIHGFQTVSRPDGLRMKKTINLRTEIERRYVFWKRNMCKDNSMSGNLSHNCLQTVLDMKSELVCSICVETNISYKQKYAHISDRGFSILVPAFVLINTGRTQVVLYSRTCIYENSTCLTWDRISPPPRGLVILT